MIKFSERTRLIGLGILLMALLVIGVQDGQAALTDIAWQSFESSQAGTAWTYSTTPTSYNLDGGTDIWEVSSSVGTITSASDGNQFWGIRDINNSSYFGDHRLQFDMVEVTDCVNVELRFDYNLYAFDTEDNISYVTRTFTTNGSGSQTSRSINEYNTNGWATETLSFPNDVTYINLDLIATQNGDGDYAGFDNVRLICNDTPPDNTPPSPTSFTPSDDATGIPVDANLSITFDEDIQFGSGNITIHTSSNDGIFESFDVSTSTALSITGDNTVNIEPTSDLSGATEYFVQIESGAITDKASTSNDFGGINDTTSWSFTTVVPASSVTAPYSQDFEATCLPNNWEVVSNDADTGNTWYCNTYQSNTSLSANGYNDSNAADEWLITPPLDFSGLSNLTASFDTWTRYTDSGIPYPQVEFLYSTDYDGLGDPTTANWNALSYTLSPTDSQQWTPSGSIDLSSLPQTTVHFAFRYQSSGTGSGSAAWWQVDDFDVLEADPPDVFINELGVSDTGTDAEFFELVGTSGTSLDGVYVVAIYANPNSDNAGEVNTVIDLSGNTIQTDGFFVGASPEAESEYSITGDFSFSDGSLPDTATTYLLVYAPSGMTLSSGNDLDTNDDGTLDSTPWNSVVDGVGLSEGVSDEIFYATSDVITPYGGLTPTGAYRCPDGGSGTFTTDNHLAFYTENGTPDSTNDPLCSAPTFTPIHVIQGSGSTVTDTGVAFTVEAVVVADLQETGELDGFFIQEEGVDQDNDETTSEGIFVYCGSGSSNCPDVNLGDMVQVTAQADDYFGMSQLEPSSSSDVTITGSTSLPAPAGISFPVPAPSGGVDYLERFEGMYVNVTSPMTVTEFYNYDRYGEIRLWTDGSVTATNSARPYQFTAQNAPSTSGYSSFQDALALQMITLDDGSTDQNPATLPYPRPGFDVDNAFRGGDVVTGLDGVLNYSFDKWRVHNFDRSADTEVDNDASITFNALNPRPASPPSLPAGDLRVASFNVLNYFTTLSERGADDDTEFQRQRDKIIEAICQLDAEIVGLNEIENNYTAGDNSAIADLVNGLNASSTCGSRVYEYVDPGTDVGDDEIAVGLVYDTNAVSLLNSPDNPTILDDTASFISGPVFNGADTNRSPLAATFRDGNGGEFTIIVNHFKSKGGTGNGANADAGNGEGNWNARRTAAAQAILDWIDTDPTGSTDDDYLVIGDLNAYDEETPITTLENDGMTDLLDQYQGEDAYGYVFDGQWGYLDYAMANSDMRSQVLGAANWHINADEADALDYDTTYNPAAWYAPDAYRSSDHDPVLVSLDLTTSEGPEAIDVMFEGTSLTGAVINEEVTEIDVSFNAEVNDDDTLTPDGVLDTVTNLDNYYLIYEGKDGALETTPGNRYCQSPTLTGDDVYIVINTVDYTPSPSVATLSINGGLPLYSADYALVICGSTSIVGLNGAPINNGEDVIFNFTVGTFGTGDSGNTGGDTGTDSGDGSGSTGDSDGSSSPGESGNTGDSGSSDNTEVISADPGDVVEVDGELMAVGADGELQSIDELPQTGEAPGWRTPLLALLALLIAATGGGTAWYLRIRTR